MDGATNIAFCLFLRVQNGLQMSVREEQVRVGDKFVHEHKGFMEERGKPNPFDRVGWNEYDERIRF